MNGPLPYDSLRERLVRPFVTLGFLISAVLSLVTVALVAQVEEEAILRTLNVELESFRYRYASNPQALPAASSLVQGHFLPSDAFPQLRPLRGGGERIEHLDLIDREYSVLLTEVGGRPFALLHDRQNFKSGLARIALSLLIGTAAMTLLTHLIASHFAGQVVRPVTRLIAEIGEKSVANPLADGSGFASSDYPNNEIGSLARSLDDYSRRLYGFIERESHFAADVSHELRTPIAVIRGASEVLMASPQLPPPLAERIAAINRHATRMAEILEALLLLSREDELGEDPHCSMADVVRDVLSDCAPLLDGRPVRMHLQLAGNPVLPVERSLAYVTVSNIVRNACTYTRAGSIDIELDETSLQIRDTGMGIAAERFPELCKRYAKGPDSPGSGIGLSIVARASARMGWHIDFASSEGKGTRVTLHFPPAATAAAQAQINVKDC